MKRPNGETVSFDFYFHQAKCEYALRDVVHYCMANSGKLSGEVLVAQLNKAKETRFTSVYSNPVYEKVVDEEGLGLQFLDNGIRVLIVGMWNAIGRSKETPDIVTFKGVSEDTPLDQPNPISIVSEGWVFSTPGYEKERNNLARFFHQRFVAICDALQPTYAAILNEDSLACPNDLRKGKALRSFANFFISQKVWPGCLGKGRSYVLGCIYPAHPRWTLCCDMWSGPTKLDSGLRSCEARGSVEGDLRWPENAGFLPGNSSLARFAW